MTIIDAAIDVRPFRVDVPHAGRRLGGAGALLERDSRSLQIAAMKRP
jgi:hypothetical protein